MPISEPINPLASHVGQGVVQLHVGLPTVGNFLEFETQCALELEGPYYRFSNRFATTKDFWLYGFPPGRDVFIQIRSIDVDGSESEWVQVRAGLLGKVKIMMELTAPVGSRINAGSLFTMQKNQDWIVGFINDEDINFI